MRVSATDAKNRFGQMLDECQRGPVVIEKAGRRHGVLLSAERYDEIMSRAAPKPQGPGPGQRFYEQYKDWVDLQNELVEQQGIPGEEHRPW